MPEITLNVELCSRPDKEGRTRVMVRVHMKGHNPTRILTSVKIEEAEKYWNPKKTWGKWIIKHIDKKSLNDRIRKAYYRIESQIEKWQQEELNNNPDLLESSLTPRLIADRFKHPVSDRYAELTAQVLEEAKAQSFRTWAIKNTAVDQFMNYAGKDLLLPAVTVQMAEQFQKFLIIKYVSPKTGSPLKASSINQYFESLSTVHKEVLKLKGHSRLKAALLCPFAAVSPLPARSTYRSKFNEEEISSITRSLPKSTKRQALNQQEAFSIWLLSHLLAGARFSDVLMLRYRDFQVDQQGLPVQLTYTMSKTGNHVTIPVFDETRVVLERWWKPGAGPNEYVLPFLDHRLPYAQYRTRDEFYAAPFEIRKSRDTKLHYWNGKFNKILAQIQEENNLKGDLRMHNARHSFADMARRIMQEDGSITPLDITLMLGQSDFRMTMKYLEDLDRQDAVRPMHAVFNRKKKG